jgi:hypothetical protein
MDMSAMAKGAGARAAATAVYSILDSGPFPLASQLQKKLDVKFGERQPALGSAVEGIATLLDAAKNKVIPES